MIPVVIGTTFLIYVMVFALPGDPTAGKCGDRACPPSVVAAINEKYHLNDPVPVGYAKYMANVLQGDLGENRFGIPVADDLKNRYPTTMKLAGMAVLIETSHRHPRRRAHGHKTRRFPGQPGAGEHPRRHLHTGLRHRGTRPAEFGVKLGWFPVTVPNPATWYSLVLPAIVLASASLAYVTRLTRASLTENLRADYVRTAKAKGLTPTRAIGVHALRNSLIPVITFIGYDFGALLGGAIVTERIFNMQGVGGYVYRAIGGRDGFASWGGDLVRDPLPHRQPARGPALRRARPEDQP